MISGYRCIDAYNTIFKEISATFFRENFHSDLIAYLLKNFEIRRLFLLWLSEEHSVNNTAIKIDSICEYDQATVKREEGRIDITILNSHRNKAILIENKSNQASDQYNQIPRYVSWMDTQKIKVECVLYLKRSELNEPTYAGWEDADLNRIKPILLVSQLRGERSLSKNVLSRFLSETNDLRMAGIVKEVQLFFDSLVFGDINMNKLEPFIAELAKNNNLQNFVTAIKAYKDIPQYLLQHSKEYCETTHKSQKLSYFLWDDRFLLIRGFHRNLDIEVTFTQNSMSYSLVVRENDVKTVEEFRNKVGSSFSDWFEKLGNRYGKTVQHNLRVEEVVLKTLDDVISLVKKTMSSDV